MKKYLLNSIAVLALALGSTTYMWADNVIYGLVPSYTYGARAASVDLDKVNTETATTITPDFAYEDATEVMCGVTAGDKYYAFLKVQDQETYDENVTLATINFTSKKIVVVNDFAYSYGKPGYSVSGMAYDDVNNVLYATEIGFDENDKYVTKLYSVNQETGAMTYVTTFNDQYQAIASDHKGGFYLLKLVTTDKKTTPSLYKASSSFDVTPVVTDAEINTGWSSNNSLNVAEDGKTVYLVASNKVVAFDTEAKTATLKGTLSDNFAGTSYGKSSADGIHNEKPVAEKKNTRFLVESWTYGSTMGDIANDVVSEREYYKYNIQGKLMSQYSVARGYEEYANTFMPYYWTKVNFDDNANVTSEDIYQWGNYDYDDFAWQKTRNSTSYTYDENGRLATETTPTEIHEYTYDEEGHLAKKAIYIKATKKNIQTITYSNYDENGNALNYSSTGAYDSYNYDAQLVYDEDGNKVEEVKFTETANPDYPDFPIQTPISRESWTYTDNILTKYMKYSYDADENEVADEKVEYTPVDGNTNILDKRRYSYSDKTWHPEGKPERYFYTDFAGMDEMTSMEFAAENDPEASSTVDVMFTVPQLATTQTSMFVIYRDGMPIDSLTNIFDYVDDSGMVTYKDTEVKNGTHTYFVQPMFTANQELEPFDAESGDAATDDTEWVGYYSTMPMDVEVKTELPTVTDLKLADGRREVQGSALTGKQTIYYATLSWKNPENADQYGFLKNSIYFEGAGVAEKDTADIAATKAEVMLYDEDVKAYVLTSYKLGKVKSESIDVKIKDIENLTSGIETVAADGTKVAFDGRNITLDDKANVSVFSLNGQKVYENNGVNSVSLDMPAATYIITVEKDGKVSAFKYNVK